MDKVLQPEELVILYFEKQRNSNEVIIHSISVDTEGNVMNPPNTYREFILNETLRLLRIK